MTLLLPVSSFESSSNFFQAFFSFPFNKMAHRMYLILIMIMSFCIRNIRTQECEERNISCNHIMSTDGFKFPHLCPEGSEIFIHNNKTVIGHFKLGNKSLNVKVRRMDNHSVITRDCQDLQVQCIIPNGENHVKEICVEYKITEKMKNPDSNVSVLLGVLFGIVLIGIVLIWIWKKWKKELKYLLTCTCLRKGSSQTEETRPHEGSEVQESTADDLDSDPRGSGENNNEQDNTLGSVHVHRLDYHINNNIDPKAGGKTPQSLGLDRNEGFQQSENGDIRALDVNRGSNYGAMNRNIRDDPGGVNDNKRKEIVGAKQNGRILGDCDPEDNENEGQLLLGGHRAAFQGVDMTSEAAALVNKRGFDPDQVSRCSTAPDTDVESTPEN